MKSFAISCIFALTFIFVFCSSSGGYQEEFNRHGDTIEWWIDSHGCYPDSDGKDDHRVKWVFEVFGKVKDAADKTGNRQPRLLIVNTRLKDLIRSIQDGGIIINPTTLDICYDNQTRKKGDSRIAFILGHELAHLANDDLMYQLALDSMQKTGSEQQQDKLKKLFRLPGCKIIELMADRKGMLYACMAGYDVGGLFRKDDAFFQYWAGQTGFHYEEEEKYSHPSFNNRDQFIRTQLLDVANQVELFKTGVLFYQAESYTKGESFFREFAQIFYSREVFNNIGACYLQLALEHLYTKFSREYYRFRLSTAIDYTTRAESLEPRGEGDYLDDREIARYLDLAEQYFKLAVERDTHDRTGRCNLAATLILKKEYTGAMALCDEILKQYPQDAGILNNKAIAFYLFGIKERLDTTRKAARYLEEALQFAPNNLEALYNLASLKESAKRSAKAKQYWRKYVKAAPRDNFYIFAYHELTGESPPQLLKGKKNKIPAIPLGIKPGEDNFSRIGRKWGNKYSIMYEIGHSDGEGAEKEYHYIKTRVIEKGNVKVVTLDGKVELVEQTLPGAKPIEEMLNIYGPPGRIIHHNNGRFYVYKERGFSIRETNGKIDSFIWY